MFSRHLAEALDASQLSPSSLAKRLDVSRSLISHWLTGARRPSPELLEKLAEVLGVDSGWLAEPDHRESTDTRPLLGLHRIEDAVWAWREPYSDGGRDFGNSNVFATPPSIDTLVRETGQNAMDAKSDSSQIVHLRYSLIELDTDSNDHAVFLQSLQAGDLLKHIEAAAQNDSKLGSRLTSGLDRMRGGRLTLLRIDDYGTTGLVGPERPGDGVKSPFAALVRNNLDSSKPSSTAGGSFGLGKAVSWRCSALATVLVASTLEEAPSADVRGVRVIGKAELAWHQIGSQEFGGPGWFSLASPDSRADSLWLSQDDLHALQMDRFDMPEGVDNGSSTGTSILVIGYIDPEERDRSSEAVCEELSRAAAENFWPAMMQGRLTVSIEHWLNGERQLQQVVSPEAYVPEFCDAFEKYRNNELVDSLAEPGDVLLKTITLPIVATRPGARGVDPVPDERLSDAHLVIRLADPKVAQSKWQDKVALTRGRLMIVKHLTKKNIVVGGQPFHAVLLAGTAVGSLNSESAQVPAQVAAEQFLRAAEPPAHDNWAYNPELGDTFKAGSRRRLEEFFRAITDALRDAIRPRDEVAAQGPEELRRLLRGASGSGEPHVGVATLQNVRARTNGDHWIITGQVFLRSRDKRWVVSPRLYLETESGGNIPLAWKSLDVSESDGGVINMASFVAPSRATRIGFSGSSESLAEGLSAVDCRLLVDVRAVER